MHQLISSRLVPLSIKIETTSLCPLYAANITEVNPS